MRRHGEGAGGEGQRGGGGAVLVVWVHERLLQIERVVRCVAWCECLRIRCKNGFEMAGLTFGQREGDGPIGVAGEGGGG